MHSKNPAAVSRLIYELRCQLQLTQEEFAHQLGVTFATVNRWENQHSKPSRLAMKQIESLVHKMGEQGEKLLNQYLQQGGRDSE
ncbi:helix-turn-helix domain-containing protein [Crocosphaera watsonii]|nr:helix-turn-helix transcriptional regulator [Crocosphaera watsonii]EHJ11505.1 XRE family transcriptional regulator [Crocosphaera watsonii WH 0003]CCQ55791.1 hypothetical protein CWATWH0005_3537 [Crocosphaera watsonii WH 0005]